MASEARRTPEKVKSSAMMPRQPDVPKWIVVWFATGGYCIVTRRLDVSSNRLRETRKSKG
jgi:hypothetical protein